MSQNSLRRRHNLPSNAFDILDWKVGGIQAFGIDREVVQHRLRYKVPMVDDGPAAFEVDLLTGERVAIPAYELTPQLAELINSHDYTIRTWGHDYVFTPIDGGMKGRMMGWGYGIEKGHFLIIQDGKGGSTRYRVDSIEYKRDPADMWSAMVTFAPRARN